MMVGFRSRQPLLLNRPSWQPRLHLILPSSTLPEIDQTSQGGIPALIWEREMAAFKPCFPTFSILYCIHFFSKPPKAQRAGETVAMGDHSCGEAASKCGVTLPQWEERLGCLGSADQGFVL